MAYIMDDTVFDSGMGHGKFGICHIERTHVHDTSVVLPTKDRVKKQTYWCYNSHDDKYHTQIQKMLYLKID